MPTTRISYIDLDKSGIPDVNNDISLITNEDAVLASVQNILEINPRNRIYKQRSFGSTLERFLFEPIDNGTALQIMDHIESTIANNEPRAQGVVIEIVPDEDANAYDIRIEFNISESERILVLEKTLERVR